MGETSKQVRVDNWGSFFLQRLQTFFNKTDYCDLTLQFNGNVQLKVHRLVLNTCTEYFQILEQTCEMLDDNTILMPQDLQSDVILPIVNFMYTGMFEFQLSNFDKLYKTAELMNIGVLTKLLDAQKLPSSSHHNQSVLKKSSGGISGGSRLSSSQWNIPVKKIIPKVDPDLPDPLPGRKLPVWKRKSAPYSTDFPTRITKIIPPDPLQIPTKLFSSVDNAPKPTRFELPDEIDDSTFDSSSFDDISYTSKPLAVQIKAERKIDSFEEIKRTAKTLKRPNSSSHQQQQSSPQKPMKPIDLDFLREQKLRTELIDYDSADTDGEAVDAYGNDDDSQDRQSATSTTSSNLKANRSPSSGSGAKKVRFSLDEKENASSATSPQKISITGTAGDVNHKKIITEVLKKYPHLVKQNKNFRLKILAKSPNSGSGTKVSTPVKVTTSTSKVNLQISKSGDQGGKQKIRIGSTEQLGKKVEEGPWTCELCSLNGDHTEFVLYYLYRKHMTDVHNEKIDSRMCKFCGHKSAKHNLLMYHQYVAHGIKPPPIYKFPKCSQCHYIALTDSLLIKHQLSHKKFLTQCNECKIAFKSQEALDQHMDVSGHISNPVNFSYDCQYCGKKFQNGSNLYLHIKLYHKEEAMQDGVADMEDDAEAEAKQQQQEMDKIVETDSKNKITILSNVKMNTVSMQQSDQNYTKDGAVLSTEMSGSELSNLEPSSEAEALSNVASGIATSLGLVDTIVVLDENNQILIRNQENPPEFILPELSSLDNNSTAYIQNMPPSENSSQSSKDLSQSILSSSSISSTDELVMVLTDHDYGDGTNSDVLNTDNSNIVVLYSHPVDGQNTATQFIAQQGNLILNPDTGMIEMASNFQQQQQQQQQQSQSQPQQQPQQYQIVQQQAHPQHMVTASSMENPVECLAAAAATAAAAVAAPSITAEQQQHQQQQEESIEMIQQEIKNTAKEQPEEQQEQQTQEPMEQEPIQPNQQQEEIMQFLNKVDACVEQCVEEPVEYQKAPEETTPTLLPSDQEASVAEEQLPIAQTDHQQEEQQESTTIPETPQLEEQNIPLLEEHHEEQIQQHQQEQTVEVAIASKEDLESLQQQQLQQQTEDVEHMDVDEQDLQEQEQVDHQPELDKHLEEEIEQMEVDGALLQQQNQHQQKELQVEEVSCESDAVEETIKNATDEQLEQSEEQQLLQQQEEEQQHRDEEEENKDNIEENSSSQITEDSSSQPDEITEAATDVNAIKENVSSSSLGSNDKCSKVNKESKISNILEDWDDTDNSQESEKEISTKSISTTNGEEKKPTVSINTLINDWEEDEDDEDKGGDK